MSKAEEVEQELTLQGKAYSMVDVIHALVERVRALEEAVAGLDSAP